MRKQVKSRLLIPFETLSALQSIGNVYIVIMGETIGDYISFQWDFKPGRTKGVVTTILGNFNHIKYLLFNDGYHPFLVPNMPSTDHNGKGKAKALVLRMSMKANL